MTDSDFGRRPPLPARVRVTRPPLPLAPALAKAVAVLLPNTDPAQANQAALAIAGGSVIGAALDFGIRGDSGSTAPAPTLAVAAGWRGKGVEEALTAELADNNNQ